MLTTKPCTELNCIKCINFIKVKQKIWATYSGTYLVLAFGRQRPEDLYEIEASWVYCVSYKQGRILQWDYLSKQNKKQWILLFDFLPSSVLILCCFFVFVFGGPCYSCTVSPEMTPSCWFILFNYQWPQQKLVRKPTAVDHGFRFSYFNWTPSFWVVALAPNWLILNNFKPLVIMFDHLK